MNVSSNLSNNHHLYTICTHSGSAIISRRRKSPHRIHEALRIHTKLRKLCVVVVSVNKQSNWISQSSAGRKRKKERADRGVLEQRELQGFCQVFHEKNGPQASFFGGEHSLQAKLMKENWLQARFFLPNPDGYSVLLIYYAHHCLQITGQNLLNKFMNGSINQ